MAKQLPQQVDWIIIGAGGSGLWLALELYLNGLLETHSLAIWEKDAHKTNDRTWCFWAKETDPFLDQIISKSWTRHEFEGQHVDLAPYQYHHIRSEDFYQACKNILNTQKNVFWVRDEVVALEEQKNAVQVKGKECNMTAKKVFNSAPLIPGKNTSLPKIDLWQSFVGYHVEWPEEVLDPESMKLMDFEVEQLGATQFMYVLPFGKKSALVELTRFGSEVLRKEEAHDILESYCKNIGSDFQIKDIEQAKIPMSNVFNNYKSHHPFRSRVIPLGTMGGAIKPSTGYGFLNMRVHAQEIAHALKQKSGIPKIQRPYRFRLYDQLLLNILVQQPEQGRPIFQRLFRNQPIQRILKFLDERTHILEEAKIFTPLPAGIFLDQLFKEWRLK